MSKTRAIRLSDIDNKLINEFLKKNSFFDFSSLARTAILNFIRQPSIQIEPVNPKNKTGQNKELYS